ncbi:trigger factor [Desulfitobacterium sp. AusDCA]|uniref:trigger factor n=1 Tax=Desulfitobacterium sp. AusDCA TaxID=3240383 RepID=UPI003DA75624
MTTTLLKADKEEATFLIEIEAKAFEKVLLEEYNKAAAAAGQTAPAFLSSQALLAQYPGLESLAGKALEKLMHSHYLSAVQELGLHPISFPKIMPRITELGKPCLVVVTVALEPELELGQYEGLEASYTPVIVTEEDVNWQLESLRQSRGAENSPAKLLENTAFASLEALKEEIRSSLAALAQEKSKSRKKEAVMKKLLELNPFTLSEELMEQQTMVEINTVSRQMGQQNLESYLKFSGRTLDDLKREVRPQAEATTKQNLLLAAISEKIASEVTEAEIKEFITKQQGAFPDFASGYEERRQRIEKTPGALEQIKYGVRIRKAADYVVDKAILRTTAPAHITDELSQ